MNYTLDAKRYTLTIGWLYPELMSTYGDRGNIIVLQKRCEWRGIKTEVLSLNLHFNPNQLRQCDLLFMGGAQDQQQKIVAEDLLKKRESLKEMIENGIPGLYICGAYQFLGKYYKEADENIIKGLGILDLYTENPGTNHSRLIGNVVIKLDAERYTLNANTLVGFENHGGRTYLGKNVKPLGEVIKGSGNNGGDGAEGVIYKNTFGTYLHGPVLPKNPEFADLLIKLALEKKYGSSTNLPLLDDSLETHARELIAKKLNLDI